MSPLVALVLAVAPVVSVTSADVRLDGRVVVAPIPDDDFLNLPALEEALRALRADGGVLECPIEAAPEVPFRVLKRVIFSCASAGVDVPTFRVGGVGPFRVGRPRGEGASGPRASDVVLAISPTALTIRRPQGEPTVLTEVDGGVPSSAALKPRLGAQASAGWLLAVVNDAVRADRLAAVVGACRAAGVPDVALMPEVAPADGTVGLGDAVPDRALGSLDKELIRKVIHANRDAVRDCYEKALARKPGLPDGKVKVKFVISAGGPVASATVAEDTVGDPALGECIASAVRRWVFPRPKGDGVVVVNYPFIFKQTGK